MTSRLLLYQQFPIILIIVLAACTNQNLSTSEEMPTPIATSETPNPTSTDIPPAITPSSLPTELTAAYLTPDAIQTERWKEYEKALAMKLLGPESPQGDVLCEWEVLGRTDQLLYVWVFCQGPPYSASMPPTGVSTPAVIHLGIDGTVQSIEAPGSGTEYARDVRKMFPIGIQERIFDHSVDTSRMEAHINSRRKAPEPPLIVLSATQMP